MSNAFRVDVVSPEAIVWAGEATMLVARTTEGEIGILAGHEPLMAALATGVVAIVTGGETISIAVHGGFLQVLSDQVTVLTDRARLSESGRHAAHEIAGELAAPAV